MASAAMLVLAAPEWAGSESCVDVLGWCQIQVMWQAGLGAQAPRTALLMLVLPKVASHGCRP
jgi:hypothetical protein